MLFRFVFRVRVVVSLRVVIALRALLRVVLRFVSCCCFVACVVSFRVRVLFRARVLFRWAFSGGHPASIKKKVILMNGESWAGGMLQPHRLLLTLKLKP